MDFRAFMRGQSQIGVGAARRARATARLHTGDRR
jgi:hypothetical protein